MDGVWVRVDEAGRVVDAIWTSAAFGRSIGYTAAPPGVPVSIGWSCIDGAFSAPTQPSPDPVAQKRLYAEAVQRHLDATVQARDYADIATCVTYADEPAVPHYQSEGQAARAWRSLVWAAVYEAWRSVEAGERDAPSVEALIAELPVIVWPSINALHSHL